MLAEEATALDLLKKYVPHAVPHLLKKTRLQLEDNITDNAVMETKI